MEGRQRLCCLPPSVFNERVIVAWNMIARNWTSQSRRANVIIERFILRSLVISYRRSIGSRKHLVLFQVLLTIVSISNQDTVFHKIRKRICMYMIIVQGCLINQLGYSLIDNSKEWFFLEVLTYFMRFHFFVNDN